MSHRLMSYVTSSYVLCHIILCPMSSSYASYSTSSPSRNRVKRNHLEILDLRMGLFCQCVTKVASKETYKNSNCRTAAATHGVEGDGRGRDTTECVLLLQNVFSYYRTCSLTTECVLLLQNVFSYYSATSVGLAWRVMGEDAMINVVYGALRNVDASLYAHLRSLLSNE